MLAEKIIKRTEKLFFYNEITKIWFKADENFLLSEIFCSIESNEKIY